MALVWEPRGAGTWSSFHWLCDDCVLRRIDRLEDGWDMINPNMFSGASLHDKGEGVGRCTDCGASMVEISLWYTIPPFGYYRRGTWTLEYGQPHEEGCLCFDCKP